MTVPESVTHYWYPYGSEGKYVYHTSRPNRTASDATDLGDEFSPEGVLGPFPTRKLAKAVADALNAAFKLGARAELVYIGDMHYRKSNHDPATR
jgi:hypothetical protein